MNNTTFSITAVIKNGFRETAGTRWPIWAALLIVVPLLITFTMIGFSIAGYSPANEALMAEQSPSDIMPLLPYAHRIILLFTSMVSYSIAGPIIAGLIMTVVKKQRGESISARNPFGYYNKFVPLAIFTVIIQSLTAIVTPGPMNLIGFNISAHLTLLFNLLVFILLIFTSQSMPLICDKNLSAVEAIKTSCQMMATRWNWLKYFALYLIFIITVLVLVVLLSILAVLIALISNHVNQLIGVILGIALAAGVITLLILYFPAIINVQANIYKTLTD